MSNNQLSVFNFEESTPIRTVTIDKITWFVGKDVCLALGYADPTNAMKQHCKGVVKRHPLETAGCDAADLRIEAAGGTEVRTVGL